MRQIVSKPIQSVERLIAAGKLDEARQALRSLLAGDKYNALAWWHYAQVAPDLKEARTALKNVIAIDADHPHAPAALEVVERRLEDESLISLSALEDEAPTPRIWSRQDLQQTVLGIGLMTVALIVLLGVVFYATVPGMAKSHAPPPLPIGARERPLVVYVYDEYDLLHQEIAPVVTQAERDYAGRVDFRYINWWDWDLSDEDIGLVQRIYVFEPPAFGFFDAAGNLTDMMAEWDEDGFRLRLEALVSND